MVAEAKQKNETFMEAPFWECLVSGKDWAPISISD